MLKEATFQNFKILRRATLPLSPFTLIVGPNSSGKSAALQAIQLAARVGSGNPTISLPPRTLTAGLPEDSAVVVELEWGAPYANLHTRVQWDQGGRGSGQGEFIGAQLHNDDRAMQRFQQIAGNIQIFSLDADAIKQRSWLVPGARLDPNGGNLAAVLDRLRDENPEKFEALNEELQQWFPEFDRLLFETPSEGHRSILLRTRQGGHAIPAAQLSQGTLLGLAILAMPFLPDAPSILCLEEPDRGLHPRLLPHVRDALYRLSHPVPDSPREAPTQVIATTHSPYLLDLYRDHPEEVVIAQKDESGARFERLSDRPDIQDILGTAPLGEIWYSGILGGVPAGS